MNKEKILISFSAIIVGAIVGVGFLFFYQSTKKISPEEVKSISISDPSPTPASGLFLTINSPLDEQIVEERLITISGKTTPEAKIVILSPNDQVAAVPAEDGSFSTEVNISPDQNIIEISAISPNGETVKQRRIVSYTTESF
jgi:hypothetical protein